MAALERFIVLAALFGPRLALSDSMEVSVLAGIGAPLESRGHKEMTDPLENLPAADRAVAVLAVSASEQDHTSLRQIFSHTNWRLFAARDHRGAFGLLKNCRIGVVLCECSPPEGKWLDLYESLVALPTSPLLIVSSNHADSSLWGEVLSFGAYDVIAKPFDRTEVTRIVSLAWLHGKKQWPVGRERLRDCLCQAFRAPDGGRCIARITDYQPSPGP